MRLLENSALQYPAVIFNSEYFAAQIGEYFLQFILGVQAPGVVLRKLNIITHVLVPLHKQRPLAWKGDDVKTETAEAKNEPTVSKIHKFKFNSGITGGSRLLNPAQREGVSLRCYLVPDGTVTDLCLSPLLDLCLCGPSKGEKPHPFVYTLS